MPAARDITGAVSGTLTAVRPDGRTPSGKRLWLCRCECGGTARVETSDILAGKQASCGRDCPAAMRWWAGGTPTDLEGRSFGRLRVLRADGSNRHGNQTWLCACECGRRLRATGAHLVSGQTQSCGCLQRERSAESARRAVRTRCHSCGRPIAGGHGLKWCADCADRTDLSGRMQNMVDRHDGEGDTSG